MALSLLFDGIALVYTFKFKGLQAHPMRMFMWISISSFCFLWPTLIMNFTCELYLDKVYNFTSFIIVGSMDALETIMITVPFQITFWYNMVIMLNIMLCLDLILTFRSPFKKPESRYWIYLTVSVLISLFPGIMRSIFMANSQSPFIYGWIIVVSFVFYLVVAILSIYYAMKHLNRPGMSSESRALLMRRHISYILMNVACQIYNVFSKITTNLNPTKSFQGYICAILIVLFFGQGIWLNLVRLLEPSYLPTFWFYTKTKVCTRHTTVKKAIKAQSESD